MKLSVVIPAYNEANNLPETLEGIIATLRDEHIPFEIVVVNDNSSDETARLVMDHAQRCPEVRLVDNVPPRGFGRAVRMGLRHFSGDDWQLRPFGRYLGPIGVFPGRYQKGLSDVFRKANPPKLEFGVGYRWRPQESNLLLAVRSAPEGIAQETARQK